MSTLLSTSPPQTLHLDYRKHKQHLENYAYYSLYGYDEFVGWWLPLDYRKHKQHLENYAYCCLYGYDEFAGWWLNCITLLNCNVDGVKNKCEHR